MSLFLIVIYYTYVVNTQYFAESRNVLSRSKEKQREALSSTPFVFLFNKSRRKFSNSLEIEFPEIHSKKNDYSLSNEETTFEIPHVIIKIKTKEDNKTNPTEKEVNMTKYLIEGLKKENKPKTDQISARQSAKNQGVRVLNLSKSMFDDNAQKIYKTVNEIRHRLNKEHDLRVVLETVQNQIERGIEELKVIKEKCDRDFVVLSDQRQQSLGKLIGLKEVMKQKKELDETLSRLLDNAVALI